jgi:hypothetical protein
VPSKKFTDPVGAAEEVPTTVAVRTVLEPACAVEDVAASVVIEGAAVDDTFTVTLPNGYAA